ncbi:CCR4-NOT transcription complex subunit 4-like isoform X2 [Anguilla rostrata]|uniref:CCR4-NOT transcription complex subunit 4-like isoform X2 n=1 Tax=Anguilla rostrata TaxID=7938 RepID=UPI0030D09C0F
MTENRKHLASVRVVQRNLLFVVGLSQRLADPEVLKRPEYFGKFGKIHKVVINNSTSYAGSQGPSASAYVTYLRSEDALRAIQCVNNVVVDGRTLKASLGTTKYCSYFLKSMQCPKPDCMYLHELGDEAASFTKEEMQAGKHQEYEQKLLQELYKMNPNFLQTSSVGGEKTKGKSCSSQRPNSSSREAWPSLQMGKTANGLGTDHRKSPPLLDGSSDSDHLTPDGPESDLGLGLGLPPFSTSCDLASPSDRPPESISIGNGETLQQIPNSDSPSPPPGLPKPSLAIPPKPNLAIPPKPSLAPVGVPEGAARSPFPGGAAESQSLFSDNSNFRHPNPIPGGLPAFPSAPQGHPDWPTAPEPQSLFTSDTIPVSSSTDWQAAFGFGSSKQTEDDLGFDPFDVTRKALADLIEKELSVQDPLPLSPGGFLHGPFNGPLNGPRAKAGPGGGGGLPNPAHLPQRLSQFQHRALCGSLSFPSQHGRHPWIGLPLHSNLLHLNHMASAGGNSGFLDLSLPPHHSTGLGGIPITGIPASSANSLDSLHDDNPPHWLKSLQTLTEMDAPGSVGPPQPPHSGLFGGTQIPPLHRPGWAPYPAPPPASAGQFHSPPPGFQTAFRPPAPPPTELLQSAAMDRH